VFLQTGILTAIDSHLHLGIIRNKSEWLAPRSPCSLRDGVEPLRNTAGWWRDARPPALVAHCGPQLSGSFVQTLVLTDVATGWTECLPVLTRDGTLVIDAIAKARELFPFPLLGVDFDNDGATRIPQERSGLGRAEERRHRTQAGRLWSVRRPGVRANAARLYRAARVHTNLSCRPSSSGARPASVLAWSSSTTRQCRPRTGSCLILQ
jgi:hypothetical protein